MRDIGGLRTRHWCLGEKVGLYNHLSGKHSKTKWGSSIVTVVRTDHVSGLGEKMSLAQSSSNQGLCNNVQITFNEYLKEFSP